MLVISIRFADTAILAIYKGAGCDPRSDKGPASARVADRAGTRIGSDIRRRRNMDQTKPSSAPELGRKLLEARHFRFRERTGGTPGQIPQGKGAEGLAMQGDHRMPHGVQHAAHLAVAALAQAHFHVGSPGGKRVAAALAAVAELVRKHPIYE